MSIDPNSLWAALTLVLCLVEGEPGRDEGERSDEAIGACQRIAMVLQLSSPEEGGWIAGSYSTSIYWIRNNLYINEECPRLDDFRFLPSAEQCDQFVAMADSYMKGRPGDEAGELARWPWERLQWAYNTRLNWITRRQTLAEIRNYLGLPRYMRAEFPPPLPLKLLPIVP
jgi:hypothetical protein